MDNIKKDISPEKKHNKFGIFIFIFVIIALITIAIILYERGFVFGTENSFNTGGEGSNKQISDEKENPNSETISKCKEITNEEGKGKCYYEVLLSGAKINPSECDEIENVEERDSCYYFVLVSQKENPDPTICEKIEEESPQSECYGLIAYILLDASFCSKTGGDKEYCYYEIAVDSKNPEICNELSTLTQAGGELKDYCLAVSSQNPDLCENIVEGLLGTYSRADCFSNIARNTGDLSICHRINDAVTVGNYATIIDGKMDCYNSFLNSETYCGKIKDPEIRDECYSMIYPSQE